MKTVSAALVLAALASQALAGPFRHSQFHKKDAVVKRAALTPAGSTMINSLGIMAGKNSCPTEDQGDNTMEFLNASSEEMVLVLWDSTVGYMSSFVKSTQPVITASIAPGETAIFSLAGYTSGAFAPIFSDTTMTEWGQIQNTWGEFTFNQAYGVFDVSREVYANGRNVTMQGTNCVSDMDTCVFKCNDASASTCGVYGSYSLQNCVGTDAVNGGINGGCGMGGKMHVKTSIC